MFTDPQVITVNAVPFSMPRIASVGQKSTYQSNDIVLALNISHVLAKDRVRSMARVDWKLIVPDPLSQINDYETMSYYSVLDRPLAGFSSAQASQLITGYKTWMDATVIGKLYGQES